MDHLARRQRAEDRSRAGGETRRHALRHGGTLTLAAAPPLPEEHQIEDLFLRIANYKAAETAGPLKAAVARARSARSNTRDGYPVSTISGGPGGGELTSVEAAAEARIGGKQRDPLNDAVRRCLAHLESAVHALDLLTVAVDNLGNVTTDPETLNKRRCWAMARVNNDDSFYRRVTIGDTSYDLGRFAWEFYRDTGALPTIQQCRQKALGRRVMHRIEPST
jgi:hypothetical protein